MRLVARVTALAVLGWFVPNSEGGIKMKSVERLDYVQPRCPNACRLSFDRRKISSDTELGDRDKEELSNRIFWTGGTGGKRTASCNSSNCSFVYQQIRVARTAGEADLAELLADRMYAIARIDLVNDRQSADVTYGLSTRGNTLERSFYFFARKLSSDAPHPSDAVAELVVFGIQKNGNKLVQFSPTTRTVYIRKCHGSHGRTDAKGHFSGCAGDTASAAADTLGFSLAQALNILRREPQRLTQDDPEKRRLWYKVNQIRTNTADALAWFTCASGCCTADALLE